MELLLLVIFRIFVWLMLFGFCIDSSHNEYGSIISQLLASIGIPVSGSTAAVAIVAGLILRIAFGLSVCIAAFVILLLQIKIAYFIMNVEVS